MKLIYTCFFSLSLVLSTLLTGCGGEKKNESAANNSAEKNPAEKNPAEKKTAEKKTAEKKTAEKKAGESKTGGEQQTAQSTGKQVVLSKLPFKDLDPAKAKMGIEPGTLAINVEGQDSQGKPLSLADYKGKVVLLDTWASW